MKFEKHLEVFTHTNTILFMSNPIASDGQIITLKLDFDFASIVSLDV